VRQRHAKLEFFVLAVVGSVASLAACDACRAPAASRETSDETIDETSGETTCTPGFTPYTPQAGHCSADHTICRKDANGRQLCHGGAIFIRCGETGERCGKRYYCDCGDAGAGR